MSQSPPPPGFPPPPPPPPLPPGPACYAPAPAPPSNGLAIASMVLGILALTSMCCLGCAAPMLAIPAVVLGHIALCQIRRPGSGQGGRGMAVAGLVTGYIALVIGILIAFACLASVLLGAVHSGPNFHMHMHHGLVS